MSTHAAVHRRHAIARPTRHRPQHAKHVPWWQSDRAHALACDIGDYVEDLTQWAAIVAGVLLVTLADSIVLAVLWPVDPHLASGAFGLVLVVILAWIWHGRRRD